MDRKSVYIFVIIAACLAGVIFLSTEIAGLARGDETGSRTEPEITVAEAKKIALSDAHVKMSNATFTRRKIVYSDDIPYYMIDFEIQNGNDTTEYEYTVSAMDGKIKDTAKHVKSLALVKDAAKVETGSGEQASKYIGVKKARLIALDDAGLSNDEVRFTSIKLENDAGRMIYSTEFESMGIEYDFDIDAVTGKVLLREVEYND